MVGTFGRFTRNDGYWGTFWGALSRAASTAALEVEHEQGDIVLLCAGGTEAGKCGDGGKKIVGKASGRKMPMRVQEFPAAQFAKFFSRGITGFENAIRVEKTAVSAGDSNFHRRVGCFREESKHQA